jgi:hypothetical protein
MYKSGSRLIWNSFFPEHVGTRKIKLLLTAGGNIVFSACRQKFFVE